MESVSRWITELNNLNEKYSEIHKLQSKVVLKIRYLTGSAPYLIGSITCMVTNFVTMNISIIVYTVGSSILHRASLEQKDTLLYSLPR